MNTRHFPGLDSLDIQLMGELESDARQTYKDLAAKLGMGRSAVTSRVQRLLDNNVIRIFCWADPVALRYKLIVSFAISTQPGRIRDVADRLAACAQVLHVHLCTGHFDIAAWALFRDSESLEDFISNELGSMSGILHVEKTLTLQEVKVSSRLLTDEKELHYLENSVKDLDDLDLILIKELQANPRQRAGPLARKLGLYESTVRRRIQRLVDGHVVRIIAVIDPLVLGYEGSALIGLKCGPDKIREIANAVASHKQVQYVSICIGRYDIETFVIFGKLSDLRHFITVELGSIPGVRDTETAMNYKVVKTFYQIPV